MRNHLSRLLAPVTTEYFLERCWGRQYLHIARNAAGYWDSILRVEDIDGLLQSEQLPAAFVNVITNGAEHPHEEWSRVARAARGDVRVALPERVLELYRKGATVILNQATHAIPGLSEACRALSQDLGFPVQGNIYLTPPNAQGFLRHADDHEVFILAVFGGKSFTLQPENDACAEIDLRAGDLLYLPRGLAHEARCITTASVHLSIGLKPIYAFQLVEELGALARQSPDFQRIAPFGPAGENTWPNFQREFAERLRDLMARTPVEALASRRLLAQAEGRNAGWSGRVSDLVRFADATSETVLIARAGIVTQLEEDGRNLQVCFNGTRVSVPKFLRPALDRVLDGTSFAIREIPGLISDQGRMEFVKSLIESGLLTLADRTARSS